MSLRLFLTALFEHGRVKVPSPETNLLDEEADEVYSLLELRSRTLSLDFPGQPPELDRNAALWAARQMFRASQCAVYRELDAQRVSDLLTQPCPPAPEAARHWSVDITFAFLPDLMRLARSASPHDPLVAQLLAWAADWPLSSVGIQGIEPRNTNEIAANKGLLRLYVDRILARKDWSRLKDEAVRMAIRRSLGGHLPQWPEAAKALKSWEQPS